MACCQTLTGISRDCESNIGGIKRVWFMCYTSQDVFTETDEQITSIAEGTELFEFEVRKNLSSFTGTYTNNVDSGSRYWANVLSLILPRMDTEKRIAIKALTESDLSVIIQDANGKYWLIGYDEYAEVTAATAETGAGIDDANQFTVEITANDRDPIIEVTQGAMEAILNPAAP